MERKDGSAGIVQRLVCNVANVETGVRVSFPAPGTIMEDIKKAIEWCEKAIDYNANRLVDHGHLGFSPDHCDKCKKELA